MQADSIDSSDMSDACQESMEDDLDSLHSLFSGPDTASQSYRREADGIASARSDSTCSIECVSPAGSCAAARNFEGNTQIIHLDCPSSPAWNHYDQSSGTDGALCANSETSENICESTSYCDDTRHSSSPRPREVSLEGSLSFCGPTRSPSQCTILGHCGSSGIIRVQDDGFRPSGHTSNHGEPSLGGDDLQLQVGSFHPCKSQGGRIIQLLYC
jgi:hypothetical protein